MKEGLIYVNQRVRCKCIADAENFADDVFAVFDCGDEDLIYLNNGKTLVVMLVREGDRNNVWETTTEFIEPVEEYKRCSKCGKLLPVSKFYVIGSGKRYSWCKDCTRIMNANYRQKMKEKKDETSQEETSLNMQERLAAWKKKKDDAAKIAEESKSIVTDNEEGVLPKSGTGFKERRALALKAVANASLVTDKMLKDELVKRGYSLGDMNRPADNTIGDMLVDENLVPDRFIVEELKRRGYVWTVLSFTKECFIFEKI